MLFAPLLLSLSLAADPTPFPLWPDKIPGPVSREAKNVPTLTVYPADAAKANGCGVVVCPGGGYSSRAIGHEGTQIAEWLNQRGIAAFILKYRTVNESKIDA